MTLFYIPVFLGIFHNGQKVVYTFGLRYEYNNVAINSLQAVNDQPKIQLDRLKCKPENGGCLFLD
jgi:hypothetical protein